MGLDELRLGGFGGFGALGWQTRPASTANAAEAGAVPSDAGPEKPVDGTNVPLSVPRTRAWLPRGGGGQEAG